MVFFTVFLKNKNIISKITKLEERKLSVKLFIFSYPSVLTYYGFSKEPSHLDGSFEYPQHVLDEK